jgi:carboxymethylenebutenolidase
MRSAVPFLAALLGWAAAGCSAPSDALAAHADDADFHAAHTLRETEPAQTLGEDVRFRVGEDPEGGRGYWVATEEDPDRVVLVFHEWWGLNNYVRETADRYAKALGAAALAVDLYEGKSATTREEAGKLMQAVDAARATEVVRGALAALQDGRLAKDAKVATVGFCFGGGWSHRAAILGGSQVRACVVFYGQPTTEAADLAKLKAPVLMVWPNKDRWINKAMVDGFREAMEKAGKRLEVAEYDADHAFANPSSQSHDSEAATDAFGRATAFMKAGFEAGG